MMILTFKYRLKDRSAKKVLRCHAWAVNQVWNYCNAFQRDIVARYRAGAPKRKWPSRFDLQRLTAGTSKDLCIARKQFKAFVLNLPSLATKPSTHYDFALVAARGGR
jgi:hypothetical protein